MTHEDAPTLDTPSVRELMTRAFNEWMRRYTEEPEKFRREFQVTAQFLREKAEGKVPSYGAKCVAYLEKLMEELG